MTDLITRLHAYCAIDEEGTRLVAQAADEIERLQAAQPAEPALPVARPPTPSGWSDTDWIAHLATMPPIGYATRDHLYGTSAAGVLRFCPMDEPGAFAVYASPQPQQTEPSQDATPQPAEPTMDDLHGDGSDHPACPECGFCLTCGDCQKHGCGATEPPQQEPALPKVGETWHILRKGATACDTKTIAQITDKTVMFEPVLYGVDGERLPLHDGLFVERAIRESK